MNTITTILIPYVYPTNGIFWNIYLSSINQKADTNLRRLQSASEVSKKSKKNKCPNNHQQIDKTRIIN